MQSANGIHGMLASHFNKTKTTAMARTAIEYKVDRRYRPITYEKVAKIGFSYCEA